MRRVPFRRFLLLAGGAGVIAAAASAVAIGYSGAGPLIHGCVKKSTGAIRIVKAGQACQKDGETALDWDQNGVGATTRTKVSATATITFDGGPLYSVHVDCPSGSEVVGGGGTTDISVIGPPNVPLRK